MRLRRNSFRGMTLIEVLISFAILLTGMVSIFAVLNAGFANHKRAINETEASVAAESVLDSMRAEFSSGGLPTSDLNGSYREYPDDDRFTFNRLVIPLVPARRGVMQSASDREYFVRVSVRWMEKGDDKVVSCDTIMFRAEQQKSR
jgi:type II secretory pathway pseudopilin PulG